MAIERGPRPESGFYHLPKRISEDERLTWEARGMLIFLLGKPDHWKVSTQNLINQTQGTRKPSGRDSVRAILSELVECGYAKKKPVRDDLGKLTGVDYVIAEMPMDPGPDYPALDPGTDYPAPADPAPANPPLVKTDAVVKTEPKQVQRELLSDLPDWLPVDAWHDFLEMRKKIKKPPTDRAKALLIKRLDGFRRAGHDVGEILEKSVVSGWTDVYAPKDGANSGRLGQPAQAPGSAAEQAQRVAAMLFGDDPPGYDDPNIVDMQG